MTRKTMVVRGFAVGMAAIGLAFHVGAIAAPSTETEPLELARVICPDRGPCYEDPRNPPTAIAIGDPLPGALLPENDRPDLSWMAVPGATSYSVRVEHSQGILWDRTENQTQMSYPEGVPPLEPGKDYELVVETEIEGERIEGRVRFRLLDRANAQLVLDLVRQIDTETEIAQTDRILKLAQLYWEYDLLNEAIETLESTIDRGNGTAPIHQLQGDLYLQAKLPDLAAVAYQKALELAIVLQDTNGQAEAQFGLARTHLNREQWDEAIRELSDARDNYLTSDNRELASQLAQLLAEVYVRKGELEEAEFWYRQALEEYEALGDAPRVENIERTLRTLNAGGKT